MVAPCSAGGLLRRPARARRLRRRLRRRPCAGTPGHDIVDHALTALRNLDHRGATGRRPGHRRRRRHPHPGCRTRFLRESDGLDLPPAGSYAVGLAFLPTDPAERVEVERQVERIAGEEGLRVLGWRDVPVAADLVGQAAGRHAAVPPARRRSRRTWAGDRHGPRAAGVLPAQAGRARGSGVYFPSLSCRTLVYKGMLTTDQLEPFFPDLSDRRFVTELALVHSRFSTNTFPSWPLAHPYRLIAHNGEINTVKGNRNWMRARESLLASDADPGRPAAAVPDLHPGRQRLGHLRRGARAAAPRRPVAAARGADDDPGGVGEPRRDGPGPAGLLRVPRDVHGAVGRARPASPSPTAP